MTNEAEQHERRAREIADATRRYLGALNTGGVAVTFAVAGALVANGVEPGWAAAPAAVFVLGLFITGGSYHLAKHKALKRRDAARKGEPEPDFKKRFWRNETWDWVALLTFAGAVMVGLWQLSCVRLP